MSDGCFSLCTRATGRSGDGLLVLRNVSLCTHFIDQVKEDVSVIGVSLCSIIAHWSANHKAG